MDKRLVVLSSLSLVLTACEYEQPKEGATPSAHKQREQTENEVDRGITQKIRQLLLDDDSLSTSAKNIRIISNKGIVTLRGSVNSEREKKVIGNRTKSVSGVKTVDNQLEVVSSEKPSPTGATGTKEE